MKVLSLKQPWAELVVSGRKSIELRKWNTNFRGEFLVHSSKVADDKNMKRFGFDTLPCGFIVGKAKLVDVKKYLDDGELLKDKDKHLATKEWGGYGFILKDIERINPTPAKGQLNFWEYET
jgi:hypothetical protein